MNCEFCGAYKPKGVKVCAKCNRNKKMAKALKKVQPGFKASAVIHADGKITSTLIKKRG